MKGSFCRRSLYVILVILLILALSLPPCRCGNVTTNIAESVLGAKGTPPGRLSKHVSTYPDDVRWFHKVTPPPSFPTKLKRCLGSDLNGTVHVPTWRMDETRNITYKLRDISLESEPFRGCPNGGRLLLNTTQTASVSQFETFSETNKSHFQLIFAILLENGYLSVSTGNGKIDYYSSEEYCIQDVSGDGDKLFAEFKVCEINEDRPVLRKCCALGTIYSSEISKCVGHPDPDTNWSLHYFNKSTEKKVSLRDTNPRYHYARLYCPAEKYEDDGCDFAFHPTTDNGGVMLGRRRTWDPINSERYCFDRILHPDGSIQNLLLVCGNNSTANETPNTYIYLYSMYIGAFFHFITTLVYVITWSKQNIHGRTLCSCTLALFFMKTYLGTSHLLGILRVQGLTPLCIANAIGAQYFMIASFTWLLVVNIDLWWTFKSLRMENDKGWKRFLLYSFLGWGFPLVVTGISVILNFTLTCNTSKIPIPDYGRIYCFISPWTQGFYLYYILGLLITLSLAFATVTIVGLYLLKREINNLRSTKQMDDKNTIKLFLKLGVLMGLSWIFEVISWCATKENAGNHFIWVIFDVYNALSAILIFVIFVCKRSTLDTLKQSHPKLQGISRAATKFMSSIVSRRSSTITETTGVYNMDTRRQ